MLQSSRDNMIESFLPPMLLAQSRICNAVGVSKRAECGALCSELVDADPSDSTAAGWSLREAVPMRSKSMKCAPSFNCSRHAAVRPSMVYDSVVVVDANFSRKSSRTRSSLRGR